MAPVNILCMKWGALYGSHYVNRLYAGVKRNLARPFRFVCFTDDARGVRQEVETLPMPPIRVEDGYRFTGWPKLGLCNRTLGSLEGVALFLDLDLVIVSALDPFFAHPGAFAIIHNWTHPDRSVGNSSVFRFTIGAWTNVLDRYHTQPTSHWVRQYETEQAFLSHTIGKAHLSWWPSEWCVSFKKHCLPPRLKRWFRPPTIPEGARIVVFHGKPNPDDALRGHWPGGPHKRLRPARWIARHWHEG